MKRCPVCHIDKDESEFWKNNASRDGLAHKCIACQRKYSQEYYQKNSDSVKKRTGKRRIAKRIETKELVLSYLQTHPCVDCGETDPVVLEFDHMRDKKYNISSMIRNNMKHDQIMEEISKCEIRCANCHKRKTAKDYSWYKNSTNNKP